MEIRTLKELIKGVAFKRLSAVEINPKKSNQHEFNGVSRLLGLLGPERRKVTANFNYLPDNEDEAINESVSFTWYNAREDHPTRTEYRLYYSTNDVISKAVEEDSLFICQLTSGEFLIVITPRESECELQLKWLFGIPLIDTLFNIKDFSSNEIEINYASKLILGFIGIDATSRSEEYLEEMLALFGSSFPRTSVFSDFSRSTIEDVSPIDNPDDALLQFLEREESLFRLLENHIVGEQVEVEYKKGDVDSFIDLSLSIINRRKARAGQALENHLSYIFSTNNLHYSRGQRTERKNKPDFLFPGIDNYHNPDFPSELLTMLGAKTTAKDRWRQVLTEAERIPNKHLITLQPAISVNQTEEMKKQNLTLVIPGSIQKSFTGEQKKDLIQLEEFIKHIKKTQEISKITLF